MDMKKEILVALLTAGLVAVPMMVSAQDSGVEYGTTGDGDEVRDEDAAAMDDDVEKAQRGLATDKDPIPKPPRPVAATGDNVIIEQAGVGSATAYAEAGVLEAGGSAGFSRSNSLTALTLSPSIGWFIADNFQISGLTNITYAAVDGDGSLFLTALVEPSYHLPFTDTIFGFAGVGAGLSYIEDAGAGFAIQPRIGMNLLIGRSGIFTPSINFAYSTVDADVVGTNQTLLTVEPSLGIQAGYTVMW